MDARKLTLILVATVLLLTAQSPNPQRSPAPANNYYYSGNWYYAVPTASPNPAINRAIGAEPSAHERKTQASPSQGATPTAINEQKPSAQTETPANQNKSTPTPQGNPTSSAEGLQIALTDYTFWLVVVGFLQFGGIITQAIFLCFTLRAAQQASNAATISAETASNAFYAANRPWVLVSDFSIERDVGRNLLCYKVYNVGPVPAVLRGQNRVAHVDVRIPDDPEFAAVPTEGLVLQPNSSDAKGYVTFNFDPPVSAPQWAEIENGRKTLFFLGELLYVGPLRLSSGEPLIYKTGFGASHKGALVVFGRTNTLMQPLTDPRYSYVK